MSDSIGNAALQNKHFTSTGVPSLFEFSVVKDVRSVKPKARVRAAIEREHAHEIQRLPLLVAPKHGLGCDGFGGQKASVMLNRNVPSSLAS